MVAMMSIPLTCEISLRTGVNQAEKTYLKTWDFVPTGEVFGVG
jgi:hypothetical protein